MEHLVAAPRMLIVFAHLLLCVFALHRILATDWALLTSRVSAAQLEAAHRQVFFLLAGLWLTGVVLAGMELGWDIPQLQHKPKLIAKLTCVLLLTANGVLLRLWCFPRLVGERVLTRTESTVLMGCGALSTTSWLMAAFFGIARPMQAWNVGWCLAVYGLALAVALPLALTLESRLRLGRLQRQQARVAARADEDSVQAAAAPSSASLAAAAVAAAASVVGLEAAAH